MDHPDREEVEGIEIFLNAPDGVEIPEAAIRWAVGWILAAEGVDEGELSITFLEDEAARDLNVRYLQHDWVPDVLSFPLAPPLLGDIYVGTQQAARQAETYGVPRAEELVRLAIHGTLHLVGYDHPEDEAGRRTCAMTAVQEAWVERVREAGVLQ